MGKWLTMIGFAAFCGFGVILSKDERLQLGAQHLVTFMQENPLEGVVLHSVLSTAITVSGIPFSLVDLGAAWVYRHSLMQAMAMLLVAKTVGSMVCFVIARQLLSESRKQELVAHPTIARVNRVLKGSPVYYGTLCRLATMPAFVKNYGLASLDIALPQYMVCCLLGSVIGVPLQAILGRELGGVYLGLMPEEQAMGNVSQEVLIGAVVSIVAMILVIKVVVQSLLGEDEEKEGETAKNKSVR